MSQNYEFEVTVTVRKRLCVSGPANREAARAILKTAIVGGLGFGPFVKYGDDLRPMETVLSDNLEIEDPK
jgi:hypothetical protein